MAWDARLGWRAAPFYDLIAFKRCVRQRIATFFTLPLFDRRVMASCWRAVFGVCVLPFSHRELAFRLASPDLLSRRTGSCYGRDGGRTPVFCRLQARDRGVPPRGLWHHDRWNVFYLCDGILLFVAVHSIAIHDVVFITLGFFCCSYFDSRDLRVSILQFVALFMNAGSPYIAELLALAAFTTAAADYPSCPSRRAAGHAIVFCFCNRHAVTTVQRTRRRALFDMQGNIAGVSPGRRDYPACCWRAWRVRAACALPPKRCATAARFRVA